MFASHVCFGEQLVEKQAVEEGIILLAPEAEARHLGEELCQLLGD
jgi:hypothetical protein